MNPNKLTCIGRHGAACMLTALLFGGLPAVTQADSDGCGQCSAPLSKLQQAGRHLFNQGGGGAVAACKDCHGDQGQGSDADGYPAIGGLQPQYVQDQLHAFRNGSRQNPTMAAIAKGMSDQQVNEASSYLQTLPGRDAAQQVSVEQAGGEELAQQGRILFTYGKKISRDQWVPGCRLCHGNHAQGAGKVFPPLAGQHASYVRGQLTAWKQGKRSNDPNGLMTNIAVKLSDHDIKAVAAYLAAYDHVKKPIWPYSPSEAQQ